MNGHKNISNKPRAANISASVAQKYFPPFVDPYSRPRIIKKQIAIKGMAFENSPQGQPKTQY